MSIKNFVIPIFIPELACPFQCLYCNQQKISGQICVPNDREITETIENHLKTIPVNSHIELGYFGGNFTGIPMQDQQHFLELIQPYLKNGDIKSIRCSTRPDYINEDVLILLAKYGVKTIELGAQSMDDEVLRKSGRGHTVQDTIQASELIRDFDFNLGLQMMIGLPKDTKEKALYTAKRIIELEAENTRIYPTLVIRDTKLEKMYAEGKYSPLSLKEAIDWTADIMNYFEGKDIKILRVGLHASESLTEGKDLITGPFHPSFRELVCTEIWRKKFELLDYSKNKITLRVHPKELNYAVGYQSLNKKKLNNRFDCVKFVLDKKLKKREYHVNYN
jgi:histone acetyltransferase (RNA polymerase elongator complex component)